MKTFLSLTSFFLFCSVLVTQVAADGDSPAAAGDNASIDWKTFFPFATVAEPLTGLKPHEKALVVKDADGKIQGWAFRTDQIDPQIRGHVGQIAVLVGLSTEGRVMAIHVLKHRETPSYFQKLGATFFQQFENHPADSSLTKLDAVTGATHSSVGIIKDVAAAVKAVMQIPSVQAAITPAADADDPPSK